MSTLKEGWSCDNDFINDDWPDYTSKASEFSKDLGPDIIQKVDILLEELFVDYEDEIPF